MSDQVESESEEIIIETECLLDEEPQSNTVLLTDIKTEFKSEIEDDFTWEEDTFQSFDPPTKKPIKQRKKTNGAGSKVKTSIQKYKKDWENVPDFKKWLSMSLHGSEYFYCKICKVDAKCGKSEIMRHMTSKKHKKNAQESVPKFKCFDGLLCPVFTPIDRLSDEYHYHSVPVLYIKFEEIHYTKISEYSDYLKRNNIRSVLINDITGEGMSLTVSERCLITEEWARETKKNKQYLMVQIGGAPLKEVVRMVRHAASKKVNAVLVLPDLYNKPVDHYDLLRYLKHISDYSDNMAIWYHHCPKYSNVQIDLKKFLMDVSEIESFVGVVFGSEVLEDVLASVSNCTANLVMSTTNDILTGATHDFKSIMTPALNFLPNLVHEIFRAVAENNLPEARELQRNLTDVYEILSHHGNQVSASKAAMNILTKVNVGQVRRPLVEIWKKQVEQMQNELKVLGIYCGKNK